MMSFAHGRSAAVRKPPQGQARRRPVSFVLRFFPYRALQDRHSPGLPELGWKSDEFPLLARWRLLKVWPLADLYVCASLWGEYMGTYLLAVGYLPGLDGAGRGDEREDGLRVIILGMHKHTSSQSIEGHVSVSSSSSVPASAAMADV